MMANFVSVNPSFAEFEAILRIRGDKGRESGDKRGERERETKIPESALSYRVSACLSNK